MNASSAARRAIGPTSALKTEAATIDVEAVTIDVVTTMTDVLAVMTDVVTVVTVVTVMTDAVTTDVMVAETMPWIQTPVESKSTFVSV
jgi:hypothetical protein